MSQDCSHQIGGDGALERYADPFKNVTQEDVQLAQAAEVQVLQAKADVELGFAKMAFLLDKIEEQKLYRALGYERFKDWVESPDIEISERVAQDLIRIRRQVVPMLGDGAEGKIGDIGISKVRAMLPLLRDQGGEERFQELTDRLLDPAQPKLTWNDVRAEVKRLRGQEKAIDARYPAIFKARVTKGDPFYRVRIACMDGVDTYDVTAHGPVLVKPEHWPRFEALFGEFVEEVDG